jgi:hypothetical protein
MTTAEHRDAIDAPGTSCDLESNHCSAAVLGHGGFDEHHRWPKFMGGPENQDDKLIVCPQHHRRQHALIRYLAQCNEQRLAPAHTVTGHYTRAELNVADYALQHWIAAGRPPIAAWSAPAAR